jgi:hypothetical protein
MRSGIVGKERVLDRVKWLHRTALSENFEADRIIFAEMLLVKIFVLEVVQIAGQTGTVKTFAGTRDREERCAMKIQRSNIQRQASSLTAPPR